MVVGPLREVLDYNLNMRVLTNVNLFSSLTEQEKERVASGHHFYHNFQPIQFSTEFVLMEFASGDFIVKEGDIGDDFFIIKEGQAEVTKRDPTKDSDVVLATIQAGEIFLLICLLIFRWNSFFMMW